MASSEETLRSPATCRPSRSVITRSSGESIPLFMHVGVVRMRSEEHTSELQPRLHLVCRLLLEKKNDEQKRKVLILQKQLAVVKYSIIGLEQASESLRDRVMPQVERYMCQILQIITSGSYESDQ